MTARFTALFVTVTFVFLALAWQVSGDAPQAAGSGLLTGLPTASAVVLAGTEPEYIGSTKCKKCHFAEHKSWAKLRHGTALETLRPGNAVEAKTKHKLDPNKDYTKDPTCVECHTVGFGKPGGYQIPTDEAGAEKMKALEGVGCESCHGPGGKYNDLHDEIMKSKRNYKVEEMYAAGMFKMEASVCLRCHNEKSPSVDVSVPFDFEKMKEKGVHDRVPLKQREN